MSILKFVKSIERRLELYVCISLCERNGGEGGIREGGRGESIEMNRNDRALSVRVRAFQSVSYQINGIEAPDGLTREIPRVLSHAAEYPVGLIYYNMPKNGFDIAEEISPPAKLMSTLSTLSRGSVSVSPSLAKPILSRNAPPLTAATRFWYAPLDNLMTRYFSSSGSFMMLPDGSVTGKTCENYVRELHVRRCRERRRRR
jgi:hypothetical protein